MVDGVRAVEVADEGGAEKGRDVAVVHDVAAAVAVDFEGVDGAVDGVCDDAVGCNGRAEGGRERDHIVGEVCVGAVAEGGQDLGGGVEVVREHHVGGDEELVDCCVIRGALGAAEEAGAVLDGVAGAAVCCCVAAACC